MLQLDNRTPFQATLSVFSDQQGVECAFVVVKASFALAPAGAVLAETPAPLYAADVYWGEPEQTSLRLASDFGLPKPATDVLVVGSAVAARKNTRVSEVMLRLGPIAKTLRIFGDRQWERGGLGWQFTPPTIWERMPLRWELAFGGNAPNPDGEPPEFEPYNPVGRGFAGRRDNDFSGRCLPNIEDPAALIGKPTDRPNPVCFAPVAPSWRPRRDYAGTYDEAWQKQRAPHLPKDFDARFFQAAASGLTAPGLLQGNEPVELAGCTVDAPLRFHLPACTLAVRFDFDGQPKLEKPRLETVLIEPDEGRVQLLWRAGIRVDKKLLKLREVAVACAEYPASGKRG